MATSTDPVLPEVRMNVLTPKNPGVGTVVSSRVCMKGKSNSFVRHVAIDVSGTPLAGNFRVGQAFGVIAPGVDADGRPHQVRLYSIACPSWGEDGDGNVIATTPKRVIEVPHGDDPDEHRLVLGVCSNYLCDMPVGTEVKVTGPSGRRFLLPVDPSRHDFLFIATGTGIAPFRGMTMEFFDNPAGPTTSRVALIMGSPYTTDLLYDDLFTGYANKHENFKYDTAISREPRPDGSRGIYVDRLLAEKLDDFRDMLASPRTLIYVCGLTGMDEALYRLLATNDLAGPYITRGDEIAGIDPAAWTKEQVKRYVRPSARCMVEVY